MYDIYTHSPVRTEQSSEGTVSDITLQRWLSGSPLSPTTFCAFLSAIIGWQLPSFCQSPPCGCLSTIPYWLCPYTAGGGMLADVAIGFGVLSQSPAHVYTQHITCGARVTSTCHAVVPRVSISMVTSPRFLPVFTELTRCRACGPVFGPETASGEPAATQNRDCWIRQFRAVFSEAHYRLQPRSHRLFSVRLSPTGQETGRHLLQVRF